VPLAFPRGEGATFTIGRHRDCDLHVADMSVSRVHAQLERHDAGGWLLSDLGSTNGTRLNGWRVRTPVLLRPGDQVKFGNAEFIIQGPAAAGLEAPAAGLAGRAAGIPGAAAEAAGEAAVEPAGEVAMGEGPLA
jgi:predicted component of type VI protein secretion system